MTRYSQFRYAVLAIALVVAASVPTHAQTGEAVISGFTTSASGTLAKKINVETFTREIDPTNSVVVSFRTTSSVTRQGTVTAALSVTAGDQVFAAQLNPNGNTRVELPVSGPQRVVITVVLSAATGLGAASITVDDVVLTVN